VYKQGLSSQMPIWTLAVNIPANIPLPPLSRHLFSKNTLNAYA
jgi:hypothetical protein